MGEISKNFCWCVSENGIRAKQACPVAGIQGQQEKSQTALDVKIKVVTMMMIFMVKIVMIKATIEDIRWRNIFSQ